MTQTAIDYEVVIGLEVHCQILTHSKMLCGCSADENTRLCPICLSLRGPVGRLTVPSRVTRRATDPQSGGDRKQSGKCRQAGRREGSQWSHWSIEVKPTTSVADHGVSSLTQPWPTVHSYK